MSNEYMTTIFIRHANREPITEFPNVTVRSDYERRITSNGRHDAQLTEKGRKAATTLGIRLRSEFDVDNMKLTSSNVQRCQDTLRILTGRDITVDPVYKFNLNKEFYSIFSKNKDVIKFIEDTKWLRTFMNDRLGVALNDGISFYYCYSNLICYTEMGIDMSEYVPDVIQEQFYQCTKYIYNLFFDEYVKMYRDDIKDIIDRSSGIVCTHDNLVFAIAKYYDQSELDLPGYMSNVIIQNGVVKYNTS